MGKVNQCNCAFGQKLDEKWNICVQDNTLPIPSPVQGKLWSKTEFTTFWQFLRLRNSSDSDFLRLRQQRARPGRQLRQLRQQRHHLLQSVALSAVSFSGVSLVKSVITLDFLQNASEYRKKSLEEAKLFTVQNKDSIRDKFWSISRWCQVIKVRNFC